MVSSEAAPLAKTGGLADVVGSLPSALKAFGDEVAVVIPRYGGIDVSRARRVYDDLNIYLGGVLYPTSVYQGAEEFPLYLVDCPPLFNRKGFYGESGLDYPDNYIRFAVFSRAAIAVARFLFRPDLFHCHDWQAGLVPVYLRQAFATDPTFLGVKTLFTIHNLGYQGLFPASVLPEISLDQSVYRPDGLEFFGQIALIKGGIMFSDAINTVSPTYAREIQTPEQGFGLDGALRSRASVLTGILNGVDYRDWSPDVDRLIPANFSADDLSGKAACKRALIAEFGLPAGAMDAPLIGIVSRFTSQKGTDLVAEAAPQIVGAGAYLVALGNGEPQYEENLSRLAVEFPGRIAVKIGFDNGLAHRVEAGADMFLMPSRYEPCGLNQIYSLRYGTIPIVRATGGLDDTIDEGTGFKFKDYSAASLVVAVRSAVSVYTDREAWQEMMRRAMRRDYSWRASAAAYSDLYRRLLGA